MKPGEIRPVSGGYGLMKVAAYDAEQDAVEMLGHGSRHGHWFRTDRLGDPVGPEVVLRERLEARARKVDCNDSGCWCREVLG